MKKPNILFLFPDQHRGDWLPYEDDFFKALDMDNPHVKMPNLKNIMSKSLCFTDAITPSPLCAPARACLASGKSYRDCGVRDNKQDYDLSIPTFYDVLKNNGYNVCTVGKLDLHKKTQVWSLDGFTDDMHTLGFTHGIDNAGKIDAAESGKDKAVDPYMNLLERCGYRKYHSDDMKSRGNSDRITLLPDELYCDNWITNNCIDILSKLDDKPWFMQVNFTGPHGPWDVTKSMKDEWKDIKFPIPRKFNKDEFSDDINGIMQNYAAMLSNIDKNIGKILKYIEDIGELDNTVIVYASDHGEKLGDWGLMGKGTPHRSAIHIPLIIHTPNMSQQVISNALVSLQDLTATFLDLAGTRLESANDSNSLLPFEYNKDYKVRDIQESGLNNWNLVQNHEFKKVFKNGVLIEEYDCTKDKWQDEAISNCSLNIK